MTREKAMELLIALSQIESYLMGVVGLKRPANIYDNLDKILEEFVRIIKEKNNEMER